MKTFSEYFSLNEKTNIINIFSDYPFMLEISKNDAIDFIDNYCKNYDPYSNKKLLRGDKKYKGDIIQLNPIKRKVNWNYIRNMPFHLKFMNSYKWNNYPIKSKSIDFSTNQTTLYGVNYELIPIDNTLFGTSKTLVGSYNKKLSDIIDSKWNVSDINQFFYKISKGNNIDERIKYLSYIFNNDKIIKTNNINIIKNIKIKMKNMNMDFLELMYYIFDPNSYNFIDYNFITNNKIIYGWFDTPTIAIKKSKLLEDYFNSTKNRLHDNNHIDNIIDKFNENIKNNNDIDNIIRFAKKRLKYMTDNDINYIINKFKKI